MREQNENELILFMEKHGRRSDLLAVLGEAQRLCGSLTPELQQRIASEMHLPAADVASAASFYSFLKHAGSARYAIRVCGCEACALQQGSDTLAAFEQELGIRAGESTADGMFSLAAGGCLGRCADGPAVMINQDVLERVRAEDVPGLLQGLKEKAG